MWKRDKIDNKNNRKGMSKENYSIKQYGMSRSDRQERAEQAKRTMNKWYKRGRKTSARHQNLNPTNTFQDDFSHPKFEVANYEELRIASTQEVFNKGRIYELKLPDTFSHEVKQDMEATGLMVAMRELVGVSSIKSERNTDDINLDHQRFWNLLTLGKHGDLEDQMHDCWKVVAPGKNAWRNDIRYLYPKDEFTHHRFLNRLYVYGLGQLLDSICDINDCSRCTVFSVGFIIVSKNNPENSPYWHMDHPLNYSKLWNVLIPIDIPVTNLNELFVKDVNSPPKDLEQGVFNYKYLTPSNKCSYGLAWNGAVLHATNRQAGNHGDPRIMLCVAAGEIPTIKDLLTYTDIERQLYGYVNRKLHNVKAVLEWQENMFHTKGQTEYIFDDFEEDIKKVKADKSVAVGVKRKSEEI